MREPTLGYRICGYFDFEPNEKAASLIADYIGKNWWANDKLKQAVASQIVNRIKVTIESK